MHKCKKHGRNKGSIFSDLYIIYTFDRNRQNILNKRQCDPISKMSDVHLHMGVGYSCMSTSTHGCRVLHEVVLRIYPDIQILIYKTLLSNYCIDNT